MTPSDEPPSPVDGHDDDGHHAWRHGHRTWPERLAILGTFGSAFLCFAIAAARIGGYLIARQRNIADFQNPAEAAAADTSIPVVRTTSPPVDTADTTDSVGTTESAETTDPPSATDASG